MIVMGTERAELLEMTETMEILKPLDVGMGKILMHTLMHMMMYIFLIVGNIWVGKPFPYPNYYHTQQFRDMERRRGMWTCSKNDAI